MEYLISDLRSSIPILQKIADGQILSFDEAWSLVTIFPTITMMLSSTMSPLCRQYFKLKMPSN